MKRVRIAEFAALGLGIGLTPTLASAQSVDIPLNYALNTQYNFGAPISNTVLMLTINVGANGGAAQPYAFDTGSAVFVTPSGLFSGGQPSTNVETYTGNTFGGSVYQTPASSLKFYAAPGETSGGISLGISGNYTVASYTTLNGNVPSSPPFGTAVVGAFGAEPTAINVTETSGTKVPVGSILGQAVLPNTTAGWVVSANGQSLAALNSQLGTSIPGGPVTNAPQSVQRVPQSVTNCNPCVTVGLTPALLAQFLPLNTVTSPAVTPAFPNSNAPSYNKFVSLNFTLSSPPGSATPLTQQTSVSLDTGFSDFHLNTSGTGYPTGYPNPVLTINAQNGGTQETFNVTNETVNPTPSSVPSPYELRNNTDDFLGIGFFVENSVLYNLAGQVEGFSPNFVTDANISTSSGSPLVIDSSSVPLGLAGVISGPGGISITNGGSATLSGTNTYTGPTSVSGGYLALVGPGSIAMSSGVNVSAGGLFDISGTASGASIRSLAGDQQGLVWLGAQTLTITTAQDAFAGSIGGGGGLTLAGGTETLSGTNIYTGGTTITGGTLVVGNNSALGTGTLSMAAGTTLSFLNTGNFIIPNNITIAGDPTFAPPSGTTQTLSGVIADGATPGTLEMSGPGTLVLSATNTYTGATNVNAGTLDVAGSIASSSLTTVANGAVLTGAGTIGNLQIGSGATFAPGSGTPGTSTTVAGNLAFQPGAFYLVQISPATASFASVSGTASLAGTVNANFATGTYISKVYTIVSAGSVSGTFGSLSTANLPANFTASLAYDSAHAYLDLTLNFVKSPAPPPPSTPPPPTAPPPPVAPVFGALNVNQINVADTLIDYFNTAGSIPMKFGTLSSSGLTAVDGEDATGAEHGAFELTNEFLSLMLDPFVYGRGGPASGGGPLGFAPDQDASLPPDVALAFAGILKAPPKPTADKPTAALNQRWTVWGASYGGSSIFDGNTAAGSTNMTASTYGFAAGADYHAAPDLVLGFALAGAGTNWGLQQGLGTGRSDAFQAGLYATKYFGPAYLGAALAFTNNWFTTNRTALGDQLTASFQGQSFGARVESGYRYAMAAAMGVTPYAAIQAQSFHTPSYSETDLTGGGFGLSYTAMSAADTRSELGARFDALTAWSALPVQLRARLAWAHDWVSNPGLDAAFQALPGTSFIVNGAPVPRDSALTSLGAELNLTPRWTLIGKFDGEFASSAQTYAGSGTLRYVW